MVVAYCSFCPKMPQKASKRGLLAQKSGGLLEFQSSGGLIKSGLLCKVLFDPFFQEPDQITIFCHKTEPDPITIFLPAK